MSDKKNTKKTDFPLYWLLNRDPQNIPETTAQIMSEKQGLIW